MPFIEARDRTNIFYKDWGTGRPVVFIHGWPVNADMWEYQLPFLAAHDLRCIAYDRRGFGRSGQPWSGYNYDTLADDLASLIDKLELRDLTLVGFSMGGGEVVRYIGKHGSARIRSIVLMSAVTPFLLKTADNPSGAPQEMFDDIVTSLNEDRPKFLHDFARQFFGVNVVKHPVSAETLQWQHNLAMMASAKATSDCVHAWSATDFRPNLAAINVPTLVMHGDADHIVPIDVAGKLTAKMVADARFIIYEGAPHGMFITHKEQINVDLLRFLKG